MLISVAPLLDSITPFRFGLTLPEILKYSNGGGDRYDGNFLLFIVVNTEKSVIPEELGWAASPKRKNQS